MYRCLYAIFFFTLTCFSYGQNCLPSGITFSSQADIDAFPSSHPNCSEIDGDVFIRITSSCNGSPTDIGNLDSLIQITSIHGSLRISSNPDLIDLSGLNNLVNIDHNLIIYCNDNLASLNGLNNLISVGGLTDIGNNFGNDKITNLIGLSNLTNPSLQIAYNPSFKNFVGLNSAINSLQKLTVEHCDSLENFVGLENVSIIHSDVIISGNYSNFDFTGLESLTTIEGYLDIFSNSNQNVNGLTSLNEIQEHLNISECPLLTDINGFSNLTSVRAIFLQFTPLTSLSGLQNVSNLSTPNSDLNGIIFLENADLNDISDLSMLDVTGLDYLLIYNNAMLSECAIEPICTAINFNPPIDITIEHNMTGCMTIEEVETACSVLPVIYSKELTAYKKDNHIILKFSVAQQINNSHFEIHHSIDGKKFKTIGEIDGRGTTSKEIAYEYKHDSPILGINYYRVKQVDFDDNFSYSNITSVKFNDEHISINPNPVFDEITVNGTSKSLSFIIFNALGEVVLQGILEENEGISVSHFDKGVYIIRFQDLPAKKFIKL